MARGRREVDVNDPVDVARVIDDFVNGASKKDMDAFVQSSVQTHLTLQQLKMSLIVKFIYGVANYIYVDGRNEISVKWAKKIVDAYPNETQYGFPLI